jgi:hypothetical protein
MNKDDRLSAARDNVSDLHAIGIEELVSGFSDTRE